MDVERGRPKDYSAVGIVMWFRFLSRSSEGSWEGGGVDLGSGFITAGTMAKRGKQYRVTPSRMRRLVLSVAYIRITDDYLHRSGN